MMEKENINNNIEDDLNRRNRNWDKISALISDVDDLSSNVDGVISDVDDLSSNVDDLSSKIDDLINYVGDLETLTTDEKSNIVGALNEIDASHKTHMAESAKKHITESGSNSNGRYIKFDDGTMVCFMHTPLATFEKDVFTTKQYVLPATFISSPTPICTPLATYEGSDYDLRMLSATATTTAVKIGIKTNLTLQHVMNVLIIGRWK